MNGSISEVRGWALGVLILVALAIVACSDGGGAELSAVQSDVAGLRGEMATLKQDVAAVSQSASLPDPADSSAASHR